MKRVLFIVVVLFFVFSAEVWAGKKNNNPEVWGFGDSILESAEGPLKRSIKNLRTFTKVGRKPSQIFSILERKVAATEENKLPSVIVLHAGTNGPIKEEEFVEVMELLSRLGIRVVVVNLRAQGRLWIVRNNKLISRIVSKYKNAILIDWYSATKNWKNLLRGGDDKVHPNRKGITLFVALVTSVVAKVQRE